MTIFAVGNLLTSFSHKPSSFPALRLLTVIIRDTNIELQLRSTVMLWVAYSPHNHTSRRDSSREIAAIITYVIADDAAHTTGTANTVLHERRFNECEFAIILYRPKSKTTLTELATM